MATTAKTTPQDLPPRGGYGPIQTERIPLKSIIGVRSGVALFLVSTFGGMYIYSLNKKLIDRRSVEMRSSRFAILPLLLAERDRIVLKQMRRGRDAEADLMKNVKGWEVGTFFGEKVYNSRPDDEYDEIDMWEYFVHSDPNETAYRVWRDQWI